MSLDNIQLPPFTLQQLYKHSLVDTPKEAEIPIDSNNELKFLGNNRRGVILFVNNKEAAWLPADQLDFLIEILSACKLTMEDVALVNIAGRPTSNYQEITGKMNVQKVFVFGISLSDIGLPFKIPEFQVQSFEDCTYLSIPAINILQENKELKRKLWLCLKQIFSL